MIAPRDTFIETSEPVCRRVERKSQHPIEHRTASMRDVLVRVIFYMAMMAFSIGCLWLALALTAKIAVAVFQ